MKVETSKTIGGLLGHLQKHSQDYLVRESNTADDSVFDLSPEFSNVGT